MIICVVACAAASLTCIEQFYKDVKQRKGEMFGGEEPAFDTRYIHVTDCAQLWQHDPQASSP